VSVEGVEEVGLPLVTLGFQLGTTTSVCWNDPEIDRLSRNTNFALLAVGQILQGSEVTWHAHRSSRHPTQIQDQGRRFEGAVVVQAELQYVNNERTSTTIMTYMMMGLEEAQAVLGRVNTCYQAVWGESASKQFYQTYWLRLQS
jgi:hypothetical protein